MILTLNIPLLLVLALFFILPAYPGYPGRAYNMIFKLRTDEIVSIFHLLLIPAVVISVLLIINKIVIKCKIQPQSNDNLRLGIDLSMIAWFMAATLSTIVNYNKELVGVNYVAGYVAPVLVYFVLRGFPLEKKHIDMIFVALCLGLLFTTIPGIYWYYQDAGSFDPRTVLELRDAGKIIEYRNATFGNLGNSAGFFALVFVPIFALMFDKEKNSWLRAFYGACSIITLINLWVCQARASFIAIFLALAIMMYFNKLKFYFIGVIILLLFAIRLDLMPHVKGEEQLGQRYRAALTIDSEGDTSVAGRITAMKTGWHNLLDNWDAGEGPGRSKEYADYRGAHQLFIFAGEEMGILGLLTSVLLTIMVFLRLIKIVFAKKYLPYKNERFLFIIGPFTYLFIGVIAGVTFNDGVRNSWIVMMAAMLALVDFTPVKGFNHDN